MKTLLLLIIVCKAIADGLFKRGSDRPIKIEIKTMSFNFTKAVSKLFETAAEALMLVVVYKVTGKAELVWMYILARVAVFNYIYWLFSGQKRLLGTTDFFDLVIAILTFRNFWMYLAITIIAALFALHIYTDIDIIYNLTNWLP